MGLSGSIPLLLKERGVDLKQIAIFSFVSMPFSLKIFWAPIVDALYVRRIGRRKSWILPIQLICGIILLSAASQVHAWIGEKPTSEHPGEVPAGTEANVLALTLFFAFQFLLMATQDIAVDGWALTLLSEENVGYAMVCNNIGQSVGYFLAFNGLISFTDPIWSARNRDYIPHWKSEGDVMMSLEGFFRGTGVLFVLSTLLIGLFKAEAPEVGESKAPEQPQQQSNGTMNEQRDTSPIPVGASRGGRVTRSIARQNPALAASVASTSNGLGSNSKHAINGASLLPTVGSQSSLLGSDSSRSSFANGMEKDRVVKPVEPDTFEAALATIADMFRQGLALFSLPAVQLLCLVLFTRKVGCAAVDGGFTLKLQEFGMPKVDIVCFSTVSLFLSLVLPTVLKFSRPLEMWLLLFRLKLALDVLALGFSQFAVFVYGGGVTSITADYTFFACYGCVTIAVQIVNSLMFTCMGYFFNTIADPTIGGTYITLLNAVMNLGALLPNSIVLWLMPNLTTELHYALTTATATAKAAAAASGATADSVAAAAFSGSSLVAFAGYIGGSDSRENLADVVGGLFRYYTSLGSSDVRTWVPCAEAVTQSSSEILCYETVTVDGFIIVTLLSTVFGVVWYTICAPQIRQLQHLDKGRWTVTKQDKWTA